MGIKEKTREIENISYCNLSEDFHDQVCELLEDIRILYDAKDVAKNENRNISLMQPWVCPVCGSGVSPFTAVCTCKRWRK